MTSLAASFPNIAHSVARDAHKQKVIYHDRIILDQSPQGVKLRKDWSVREKQQKLQRENMWQRDYIAKGLALVHHRFEESIPPIPTYKTDLEPTTRQLAPIEFAEKALTNTIGCSRKRRRST